MAISILNLLYCEIYFSPIDKIKEYQEKWRVGWGGVGWGWVVWGGGGVGGGAQCAVHIDDQLNVISLFNLF